MTALHRAAKGGYLQVVEYLLSKGVEVDSRDNVSTYNNVMYCVIAINSDCVVLCMKCVLLEYQCTC